VLLSIFVFFLFQIADCAKVHLSVNRRIKKMWLAPTKHASVPVKQYLPNPQTKTGREKLSDPFSSDLQNAYEPRKKNKELDTAGRDISNASGRSRRIVVCAASSVAELYAVQVVVC
jgi:hypothetical protein